MAFVTGPALPTSRASRVAARPVSMTTSRPAQFSRRELLTKALAAAAIVSLPRQAFAEREYPNVGFLGGGDQIDINNANVRAYQKFRGFYPTLAGLIVTNGPYSSVDELYKLPGLTDAMKNSLDEYKEKLVALEPTPEYEIDKINNGLYR
ncbi:Photosystem II 12 kDa extrinsic protein, chloroplastic [Gracilariopsis chorda]|uniref:Photosystem II 12 kDa extrinsic protein n=1 Tax=Gracilariopsis chorda TaxID=448386 RepID=A0A2V3IHK0_9FLOR|nr:Photosystem II 12 kDa extrinsic protein, chloroplastic [Gracilariopsis chorda]|eukprot:PXF41574.1 Photosystem II 12 kDa extrinsic protein, chloroplastic [Gracilariopsis chorda]